ncbi:MAG: hypothetical protein HC788_13065, partial [Sphingopyxis sp.]|nr:hypothetical protein [Sphingopyxis sp.]
MMVFVLGLVLAGALGNLYDRVVYGAVRDMLHMFPGVELPFGWTWPNGLRDVWPWVFNGADVSLLVGVGVLLMGIGNGLIMWAQKSIPSGITALLVATFPLWLTLAEA